MPAGYSVRRGALDLIPGHSAQLATAKADIAQDVIVEIFYAQKYRAIAKVALDRSKQSCNQHGRFPENNALDTPGNHSCSHLASIALMNHYPMAKSGAAP
jgi:hypothetical protein